MNPAKSTTAMLQHDSKQVSKLLDSLQTTTLALFGIVVVLYLSGIKFAADFEILGFSITRNQAVDVGTLLICALNLSMSLKLIKLLCIFEQMPDVEKAVTISSITSSPWSANPFCLFDGRLRSIFASIPSLIIFVFIEYSSFFWTFAYGRGRRAILSGFFRPAILCFIAGVLSLVLLVRLRLAQPLRLLASRDKRRMCWAATVGDAIVVISVLPVYLLFLITLWVTLWELGEIAWRHF
jgi:hypothetical protein